MSQFMLYVFPLILGRTIDLNNVKIGADIFHSDHIQNAKVIENPITETMYKVIDSSQDARDLLDVSGSFSLNVKGGLLKAGAAGAYMTDTFNRQNTVEVVVRATYQTVTETLDPEKLKPVDAWQSISGLGTHYVRSIVYGGEFIASIKLECNNTRGKQNIKAALEGGGRIKIFDIGAEVEGEFFSEISKTIDTVIIKVFSSVPLTKIPHDMKELKALLTDFTKEMKEHNMGRGVPLKVELWPLEYLDSTRTHFLQNQALEAHLNTFEARFDDLLNTKAAIKRWMKILPPMLNDEREKRVGIYYDEVLSILKSFYDVIGKLTMSKNSSQLAPALNSYGKHAPGFYYQQYLKFKQEITNDQGEWTREKGSGRTFMKWGSASCGDMAETLHSGFAAGPRDNGGGSNLLCFSNELRTAITEENVPLLSSVSYEFLGKGRSGISCASCRLATKGSVNHFVGVSRCPSDWHELYVGIFYSSKGHFSDVDSICISRSAVFNAVEVSSSTLFPVSMSPLISKTLLPCAICAR